MPDKDLDPVEWELVRADIAMEKARLKANGDWAKWEEFQAESNAIRAGRAAPADRTARAAGARSPAATRSAPHCGGPSEPRSYRG